MTRTVQPAFGSAVVTAEPDAWRRAAAEFRLPILDLGNGLPEAEALRLVDGVWAQHYQLLPWRKRDGTIQVALADPLQLPVLDELALCTGCRLEPFLAEPSAVRRLLAASYGHLTPVPDPVLPTATEAPVLQLVEQLLARGIARRASDIHVEPLAQRVRVRYRIDGVLQEGDSIEKASQAALVSRLKIMANLSIAEKRLPQDGRIRLTVAGRPLDLRVSTLPTVQGESVVLRVLDKVETVPELTRLGFAPEAAARLLQLLAAPDGLLLVTGPTGSGKTTTLYAGLQQLNEPGRKIITVEDPIEFEIAGVNQVPVRSEQGMTFASALRAMLRQSPNLIMVGEIRDRETAETAVQAALTGHAVLSTLHTNDAPGAIARLIDLGVKPVLVASALRAVVAQRLVRRVCPQCAVPDTQALRWLPPASANRWPAARWQRGRGCLHCQGTGYRGRLAIYEILEIDESLRAAVLGGVPPSAFRAQARLSGWCSLREDGLAKASTGLTTVEEVVSVSAGETS